MRSGEDEVEVAESGSEAADEGEGRRGGCDIEEAGGLERHVPWSLPFGADGDRSCSEEDEVSQLASTGEDCRQRGKVGLVLAEKELDR